jgi:hypothetical protein
MRSRAFTTAVTVLLLAGCRAAGSPAQTAIRWQSPIDIATGGGTKGPWQQNESNFDYVDDPSVALLPDGAAAVVWVDHRDKDVHFQIFDGKGRARLAKPANISRSPDVFSWLPRIVVSRTATYVLWQEIIFSGGSHGGDILFAYSTDNGATFSEPLNLSRSRDGDGKGRLTAERWHNGSLDLALAPDGTLHAAWTEYDGPLWFTSSSDGGKTFAAPAQVAGTREQPARAPSLAVAANGTVHLAWTVGESDSADIHVASRTDSAWSKPTVVAATPSYSDAPKLAFDDRGTLHVVFAESSGDRLQRGRIYHARSTDRGKTFSRPIAISPDGAAFPALAIDGRRVHVLWEVVVDDQGRSRGLGLASSQNGGARFDTTALVEHSRDKAGGFNGSHQGHLMSKLAADDGAIAIVNASLAAGRGSHVWLLRGRL